MGPLSHLKRILALKKKKKKQRARADAQRKASVGDVQLTDVDGFYSQSPSAGSNTQHEIVKTGSNRSGHALLMMNAAIEILSIVKEASEASSVFAPLKALCAAMVKLLELSSESILNNLDIGILFGRLEAHYRLLETETQYIQAQEERGLIYEPNTAFLEALQVYLKTLEAIKTLVEEMYQAKHKTTPLTQVKADPRTIIELEAELETGFGAFMRKVQNCILGTAMNIVHQDVETRLSQILKGAVNARGERIRQITPGTRTALIERLKSWARSRDRNERIFWLHDEAGTGKSALAAHMASQWDIEGILAGRFFFDRNGDRNLRRLDRFCVTLAQELAETYPPARQLILETMEEYSAQVDPPFKESFDRFLSSVVRPISSHLGKPLIFVFDALDECAEDDVPLLVGALLSGASSARFLLTSRPTREIVSLLDGVVGLGGSGAVLLDIKSEDAVRDHDIAIYVRLTLVDFSEGDQNIVIECAKGVFLWATLACETLKQTITPIETLLRLQSNTPHKHMANLYETVLEAALPKENSTHDLELLRSVIQGITLAYIPISIFSIRSFFPRQRNDTVEGQEYVEFFVKKLGSIMKDGTPYLPVHLLHPTFKEFIEDQKQGAKFYVAPPDGHRDIAIACLDLLSSLTPDVFGLEDQNSPLPIRIPEDHEAPAELSRDTDAPLRYAIIFWAKHAALSLGDDDEVWRRLSPFFESKFLVWVEWSSALDELSEVIEGLRLLLRSVLAHATFRTPKVPDLTEKWCTDSFRFLIRNSHTIDMCGLQVWMSALVFTPKASAVYQNFVRRSRRPLPSIITEHADVSNISRVLDDAGTGIAFVAFSPDGKRILSHENSSALRLWNARSFKLINVLSGHYTGRLCAKFSSDGSLIASGGGPEAEIYLWDGLAGNLREKLPRRHARPIIDVAFALSDNVVVSIAEDDKIIRWNVTPTKRPNERGVAMQGEMHTDRMTRLATSPDGRLVATFSKDRTVRIWDVESAKGLGNPMIGGDEALTGAFSADGKRIVAGYKDGMVIVWDLDTRIPIYKLEPDLKRVRAVAVSPDGRIVASGNARLSLWDIDTGKILCPPLMGHTGVVNRLLFDRTGNRLISGSMDNTVRVWDIRRNGADVAVDGFVLQGHTNYISGISLSPNGRIVASSSQDGTLRLWDTDLRDAGNEKKTPDYTHDAVAHLSISGDEGRIVSAGANGTLQVWDVSTGKKLGGLLVPEQGIITLLRFSSISSLWATGHSNGNVCLWRHQADAGDPSLDVLACQQGGITCIEFTPDNSWVASGGKGHSIQLWDLSARACVAVLDCCSSILRVAISRDGRYLASASRDSNIRLWDLVSPGVATMLTPSGYSNAYPADVNHLVFSPDDTILASSRGGVLRLFDLQDNLRCFANLLRRQHLIVDDVLYPIPAFSLSGKYLYFDRHVIDLSVLSRAGYRTTFPPDATEGLPFNPVSPLFLGTEWSQIYSVRWDEPLLVLPSDVKAEEWVAHSNTLVLGLPLFSLSDMDEIHANCGSA